MLKSTRTVFALCHRGRRHAALRIPYQHGVHNVNWSRSHVASAGIKNSHKFLFVLKFQQQFLVVHYSCGPSLIFFGKNYHGSPSHTQHRFMLCMLLFRTRVPVWSAGKQVRLTSSSRSELRHSIAPWCVALSCHMTRYPGTFSHHSTPCVV